MTALLEFAIASLLEHYPNKVEIVQLDDSTGEIRSNTSLAFRPPLPSDQGHFRP